MIKIVKMDFQNGQYRDLTFLTGILLIIAGLLSLFTLAFTTFLSTLFIGWLLIIGGFFQIIHSVKHYIHKSKALQVENGDNHGYKYLYLGFLNSLFSIITGIIIIYDPFFAILSLTLLFSVFFIVSGTVRIINALIISGYQNKLWLILNGITGIILGILILSGWPDSSLWFIGLYVAVDFILTGWTFVIYTDY